MKTKYKKVAVSERLPHKNLNVILIDEIGNTCNGYYSDKNNWIISTEGYFSTIEYWLEEVPDYEEEMMDVLEFLIHLKNHKEENGKTDYYNEYRNQAWFNAEELLTKLKQQS